MHGERKHAHPGEEIAESDAERRLQSGKWERERDANQWEWRRAEQMETEIRGSGSQAEGAAVSE